MLVRCPDCGAQISQRAPTCPQCGAPAPEQSANPKMPSWYGPLLVIGVTLAVGGGVASRMNPALGTAGIVGLGLIAVLIFMLPAIVAYQRNHPYAWLVLLGTLLLGGTGVGWLAMLVWACVQKAASPRDTVSDSDTEAFRQWRAQQR